MAGSMRKSISGLHLHPRPLLLQQLRLHALLLLYVLLLLLLLLLPPLLVLQLLLLLLQLYLHYGTKGSI